MVPKLKNSYLLAALSLFAILVFYFDNQILTVLYLLLSLTLLVHIIFKQEKQDRFYQTILRKQSGETENRVESVRHTLTQFIESIPFPIVYINPKGHFEYANQNFRALIDSDIESVYDTKFHGSLKQYLLDAFLNETQYVRTFNYQSAEYQIYTIPLHKEKRYDGCMVIFQDITRIRDGERNQKRFIADASHELRTPIAAIMGMVEILNRADFNDPETEKEFLIQIAKETKRLEKIVDDLLLQSRLQANKVYLELSTFNLRQFFEGIILENRATLHQNRIEVILNCPSDIMLSADHFRLRQVFLNLLNNAMNYVSTDTGQIRINCSQNEKGVTIEFKDNGTGMSEEIRLHIFERFFRGDPSRQRNKGGNGLGLAISKAIIEAHHGSIDVKSKEGAGTSFTIKLTQS